LASLPILRPAAADNTRQVADVVPAATAKDVEQEEVPGGFRAYTERLAMGSDRSMWSGRDNVARLVAGAGALLLPVAMFLPWYRDADGDGATFSAWGGYWFVIAEMLVLLLVGAGLALGALAGKPLAGPAVNVVIGFAFVVTVTVVIALFIARPGGNAETAVAFGAYVGLAAINTIKGGAILMAINARRRLTVGPALAMKR
jgi:hypothetical protein